MITHEGKTLTQLLARRDALTLQSSIIRRFLDNAAQTTPRYGRAELKIISTVDVPSLRKESDRLSEEIRQINLSIQEVNWTNDLIE